MSGAEPRIEAQELLTRRRTLRTLASTSSAPSAVATAPAVSGVARLLPVTGSSPDSSLTVARPSAVTGMPVSVTPLAVAMLVYIPRGGVRRHRAARRAARRSGRPIRTPRNVGPQSPP